MFQSACDVVTDGSTRESLAQLCETLIFDKKLGSAAFKLIDFVSVPVPVLTLSSSYTLAFDTCPPNSIHSASTFLARPLQVERSIPICQGCVGPTLGHPAWDRHARICRVVDVGASWAHDFNTAAYMQSTSTVANVNRIIMGLCNETL